MTEAIIVTGLDNTKVLLKKNKLLIILCAIFTFGLFVGSWAISLSPSSDCFGVKELFSQYYSFVTNQSFWVVFLYSISAFFAALIFCYLSGLCALGNFLNIPMLFFIGFGCGITSGYLYFSLDLSGIGFFAVIILPSLFLFCITLIISIKQAFVFSSLLFSLIRGKRFDGLTFQFKKYSIKFLIFSGLNIVYALIYSAMAVSFSQYFNLY